MNACVRVVGNVCASLSCSRTRKTARGRLAAAWEAAAAFLGRTVYCRERSVRADSATLPSVPSDETPTAGTNGATCGNRNDIFHGTAKRNTNRIIIAVKPQITTFKSILKGIFKPSLNGLFSYPDVSSHGGET